MAMRPSRFSIKTVTNTFLYFLCKVKNFRQTQQYRPKKSSLVIGFKAITEALQSGKQLERIYLQSTLHGAKVDELRKVAETFSVPINKVPIEKLSGFNVNNHE